MLLAGNIKPGLYRFKSGIGNEQIRTAATQAGWLFYHVDGSRIKDKATFLDAFAAAFHFPSYFGHNWDAFEESLQDLSWEHPEKAAGILIVYHDAQRFAKAHPQDWATALAILGTCVDTWSKDHSPMAVLFSGDAVPDCAPVL
jgi:RNAse (barnase) inhibitor barstar